MQHSPVAARRRPGMRGEQGPLRRGVGPQSPIGPGVLATVRAGSCVAESRADEQRCGSRGLLMQRSRRSPDHVTVANDISTRGQCGARIWTKAIAPPGWPADPDRGEPRVPSRAGARLLSRLHRRGAVAPDCCSQAPPAARDVCAAPLAPGHPREGGRALDRSAAADALPLEAALLQLDTSTSSCTDSRTTPAMQSGLAPDDETSAGRPAAPASSLSPDSPQASRARKYLA